MRIISDRSDIYTAQYTYVPVEDMPEPRPYLKLQAAGVV